jgi:Holliday junction resolvase
MFKSYRKGYLSEWQLMHTLAKMGFMVIRSPRSGRIGLASPDIIAAKNGRLFVIECKSRAEAFTIPKDQLQQLKEWQVKAGAIPYIGWKIARKGWSFLKLEDVVANNGNIGKRFIEEKGMTIEKAFE